MAFSRPVGLAENISTYGDGTRDFTSWATWEAATDNDLVTATVTEVLEMYADSSEFDDRISPNGGVYSADYRRIIRPGPGQFHDGTSNSGVRVRFIGNGRTIDCFNDFFSIQDICLSHESNTASSFDTVRMVSTTMSLMGVILYNSDNLGSGAAHGISVNRDNCFVVDCIIENSKTFGLHSGNAFIGYNNTAVSNGSRGFSVTGTPTLKNCISDLNPIDFIGAVNAASTNNVSGDSTAPGLSPTTLATINFVNAAGLDYHIAAVDAFNAADLSADATFPFSHDVDRQTITTWRAGADAEAGAPSTPGGSNLTRVFDEKNGWYRSFN